MSKLTERANYLKGLADGMHLSREKDTDRLMLEVIQLMADMAADLETVADAHNKLNDYVETLDDDLADLEEAMYDDGDEEDFSGDDEDEEEDEEDDGEEDEEDEDGEVEISYACPHCGCELTFKASEIDFEEEYLCPDCGKPVFPEIEEEDEEDGGDEE